MTSLTTRKVNYPCLKFSEMFFLWISLHQRAGWRYIKPTRTKGESEGQPSLLWLPHLIFLWSFSRWNLAELFDIVSAAAVEFTLSHTCEIDVYTWVKNLEDRTSRQQQLQPSSAHSIQSVKGMCRGTLNRHISIVVLAQRKCVFSPLIMEYIPRNETLFMSSFHIKNVPRLKLIDSLKRCVSLEKLKSDH